MRCIEGGVKVDGFRLESKRMRSNRVHQSLFEEFQNRIRQGTWLPGDRIPSITQLAEELGVSTGSVREALRSLQTINMVRIEHGSGCYVTGTRPMVDLTTHFQEMGDEALLALAETRRLLEPELAYLAAERGTDEELAEIEGLARQMIDDFQRGNDFSETDVLFHQKIARAARNPILQQVLADLRDLHLELRKAVILNMTTASRALRLHVLIAEAIRSRDAEHAKVLMQGEMNAMVDDLLASRALRRSFTPG